MNENLKKSWTTHVRVFEKGNNYLVIRDVGQQPFFLSFISFILGGSITIALCFKIFHHPLCKRIFKMFFTTLEAQEYNMFFILSFMFVVGSAISYLIYIILKKLNFLLIELRFIGDKLEVINGNSKKEIRLSDIVKFSIEKFKAQGQGRMVELYRLNLCYFSHDFIRMKEDIHLLNIENYRGAELILNRINKYLEDNKN